MGREIKRVPLDFDWPLNKVWRGYLLPERLQGKRCPDCEGGQTHFGWWLQNLTYLISMLASDVHERQWGKPMHPWLAESERSHGHFEYQLNGEWLHSDDISYDDRANGGLRRLPSRYILDRPGPDALEFFHGILAKSYEIKRRNGDPRGEYDYNKLYAADSVPPVDQIGASMGHSSNGTGSGNIQSALLDVLADAAGVSTQCPTCEGEGTLEEFEGQAAEREAWYEEDTDLHAPPAGDGWQLWETVSEGSPISPVFATKEELSAWMQSDAYSWGASSPLTKEQADNFVGVGWAPSMISVGGQRPVPGEQVI